MKLGILYLFLTGWLLIETSLSLASTSALAASYKLAHRSLESKAGFAQVISLTKKGQADISTAGNRHHKPLLDVAYPACDTPASYTDVQTFARVHLTVGPEVSLFSQSGSARWSNQYSGLGMNQSIGVSARFDYRFIRAVAFSVTGGYAQWKLTRNYLLSGTEKYDETIQLTRIPIQAGFKLYPYRGLYLLPEGGVSLMTAKTKTSGMHPKPTDQQSSSTPVTYGVSLGYEFNLGGLLFDLSGRYQILDVKNLGFGAIAPALTEKVQLGSLRLGVGFNARRK